MLTVVLQGDDEQRVVYMNERVAEKLRDAIDEFLSRL